MTTREERTTYVYLARDAKGNFFADYPFVFSHPGGDTKRTPAAVKAGSTPGDKGARLVRGTIKGAVGYKDLKGNVSQVPELKDVIIDVP